MDTDEDRSDILRNYLQAIVDLQNESSLNAKKTIIENNKNDESFKRILYYAVNPLLTFNVSERTLTRPMPMHAEIPGVASDIFEVCDVLSSRKALDDRTVLWTKAFLEAQEPDEREIFVKLLAKTLRLGVSEKTVNKIIPNLVPEWEVQQAYPIEKYPIKPGTWFTLTQKLNGVRATYFRGKLYARSGDTYEGLTHITDELAVFNNKIVFDGELLLKDKGGMSDNEAFRTSTGIINSESSDKSAIYFRIFDALPSDEFEYGKSKMKYKERRQALDYLAVDFANMRSCGILPVLYQGTDQKMIETLLDKMVAEDKEGLVANLDVQYKCRRHNGILKIKRFYTMDLRILRCEEGSGRLSGTLGALVVDFKGNEVKVGSGFTDEQRGDFWKNRDKIVGELCEVKYKEVSSDKKTGTESLQFPVFVAIRTDKTEVSYG